MPSRDEIYQKVSATLVEALNVDEEDIKPTSTLQGDLGARPLDTFVADALAEVASKQLS